MEFAMKRFFLLLTVLLPVSSVCVQAADTPSSRGPERRYQAVITAVDPVGRSLHLRHKPTGYETEVFWDGSSKVSAAGRYDLDDVPEGWVTFWAGAVDSSAKTVENVLRAQILAPADAPSQADAPAANRAFRARLIRKSVVSGEKPSKVLLTKDGSSAYFIDVNGELWSVLPGKRRPQPEYTRLFSPEQFKAGLGLRELVYLDEPGHSRLVSAVVQLPVPKACGEVGGGTGTTVEKIESETARLRALYSSLQNDIRKLAPVKMRVEPEISLPGEPVFVRLEARAAAKPNSELILNKSYLQETNCSAGTLKLDWKAHEQEAGLTRYTAETELPALPVGQHNVQWNCDIGGDIKEFWRSFAVADRNTLVVMLHFTSGKVNKEFDEFRLPYDYWEEGIFKLISGPLGTRKIPASAADWLVASKEYRRRGAMPNTHIIGGNYAGRSGWPPPVPVQFCAEPTGVQKAVLQAAVELTPMLGFRVEDLGCTAYEFSTETVNLAREAGIRLVGSMCIHQNWQDGAWGINHTARPLRPYFSARDDFRKAGPGGSDGTVMISQHDKSILWTEYGLGVFEPAWLEQAWVGGDGGGRSVYDDIFMSRDYDLINASMQNTINQEVPFFQSIGIEFSKSNPEEMVTKSNALMIRYAVNLAAQGRVVFCNQSAAADFYRRHYQETPETLFYDTDFWCGIKAADSITSSWKPVDYPDLIQIENARYSAYFKRPAAIPEYHWDYTVPWSYPVWGNETLPRNQVGVLVPGEHDKFAVTPKITDTREIRVSRQLNEQNGSLEVVIHVDSQKELKALPLALWDLPREWKAGGGWWKVAGANRFVPIRAPYTGNLNGILEVDVKPGENEYRLTITTPPRDCISQDIVLPEVHGKIFERDGQSMIYFWPSRPWDVTLELEVPAGKQVQCYAAPGGERVELKPGRHQLTIPKERWMRVVGLSREDFADAFMACNKQ